MAETKNIMNRDERKARLREAASAAQTALREKGSVAVEVIVIGDQLIVRHASTEQA